MRFRNSMARRALLTVLLGLLAAGCTGMRFSIPNTPSGPYDKSKGRRIYAEESGFQLLLLIPIGINERHQRAWRQLETIARGDFITDVKIQDSWTYAFVGTIYGVRMEAMAYPYLATH